jgi:GNAT superfamily N-acetyltransferase
MPKVSDSLYQTDDRDLEQDADLIEDHDSPQVPMGLPPGLGPSVHNVNTVVQPSITVQGSIYRLKATEELEAMPIKKGVNFSKSLFRQDLKFIQNELTRYNVSFLGKKNDLSLYWLKNRKAPLFYFKNLEGNIIGYLDVDASANNTVRGVYLDDSYRGQGLGTVLYLAAIKYLKKLRSSNNIGIMAVRSWKSVSKYFKVHLHLDEYPYPEVDYQWGSDGVPIVEGKRIDKVRDYFYFEAYR